MTRRGLAVQNGQIVRHIAESTVSNNPDAKYVVITNPVDAMAMVCKKYSKANFVISTGTNLETLRLRTALTNVLNIPPSEIKGWVGGEHGTDSVILWSTVKIKNKSLAKYLDLTGKKLDKQDIENYVKNISKQIIDNIGGTEFGPAASFRDIFRAMVLDTNEILPIASETIVEGITYPVFISIPINVGKSIGSSIYKNLSAQEKSELKKAANSIYKTFRNINL